MRAFPPPGQSPVSGANAGLEDFGVDSFSIIADVQAELAALISDLYLDRPGLRVAKRVPQ